MNLSLNLNVYTSVARSDYNSGGRGVRTTVCAAGVSGGRTPQGFLPRLAGRSDGSSLLLFEQRKSSWIGLCWLLGQDNIFNFSLLFFLLC